MKLKPLLSLALLFGYLTLTNCTFNNVDEPTVVVNIEDEFSIQLWEMLAPTQRNFTLRTTTLNEEDCLNYELAFQVVKRNNRIRASIDEIVEPDDCLPGKSRPAADMDLGIVENGLYEFEINLQNSIIVNTGQLVVNDDSYLVEMNSTDGITITPKQLLRVQEGTIWGYIGAEEVSVVADSFTEELGDLVQTTDFAAGDYGYFKLNAANDIEFPIETDFSQNALFIFNYTGNLNELPSLVERFAAQYGEEAELKIYTWRGDVL